MNVRQGYIFKKTGGRTGWCRQAIRQYPAAFPSSALKDTMSLLPGVHELDADLPNKWKQN